jgi:hypothetical protein
MVDADHAGVPGRGTEASRPSFVGRGGGASRGWLSEVSADILVAVMEGDEAALAALATHLYSRVPEQDHDAVQSALLRLLERIRSADGSLRTSPAHLASLIGSWIAGAKADLWRVELRRIARSWEIRTRFLPALRNAVIDEVIGSEEWRRVVGMVWSMREPARTVMLWRMSEECADDRTAAEISVFFERRYTAASVRSIVSRSMTRILEVLSEMRTPDPKKKSQVVATNRHENRCEVEQIGTNRDGDSRAEGHNHKRRKRLRAEGLGRGPNAERGPQPRAPASPD